MARTLIPYKIKCVEQIHLLPKEERERVIKEAGYNLFRLRSDQVYIDLLTDSGTGAMSAKQWSAVMVGDEAYAGSTSFFRLEKVIQDIMGLPYVIPAHQGRAAEQVLDSVLVSPGKVVPGNAHFDTTKAHIEFRGGRAVDCTIKEGKDPTIDHPFKGNLDLNALKEAVTKYGKEQVAYVLITITCNSGGGQPVSMANIRQVSEYCKTHGLLLLFDAARFAENAFFIQRREPGYNSKTIPDIVKEMFDHVDGCTMSAKKDGLVPIGGFLALRNEQIFEDMKPSDILFEGFYTYGGMSGMDMESMAQGLTEVIDEEYLAYRIGQTEYLGKKLDEAGIPVVKPFGGHAVFIDARRFYPNVPESQFPAQLACVEIYKHGGIRSVEVGSCLIGRDPDSGENIRPALDLCRLALPRRAYTLEHLDYVADVIKEAYGATHNKTAGLMFDVESKGIRHFTSTFKYV